MVHFRQHPGYRRAMDVPEDFYVSPPQSFDAHLGRASGDAGPGGVWVEVSGGGLPIPLMVRIDRTKDGRFVVTGMLVGRDDRREVDWATLRAIKPASIVSMIFAGFDPRLPEKLVDEKWWAEKSAYDYRQPTFRELYELKGDIDLDQQMVPPPPGTEAAAKAERASDELLRALHAHEIWRMTGGEPEQRGQVPPVTEATRARASVATNLTEFAETYRRHFAANLRRATTATAEELHISRATAIRRIAECREIGLLPPKERRSE